MAAAGLLLARGAAVGLLCVDFGSDRLARIRAGGRLSRLSAAGGRHALYREAAACPCPAGWKYRHSQDPAAGSAGGSWRSDDRSGGAGQPSRFSLGGEDGRAAIAKAVRGAVGAAHRGAGPVPPRRDRGRIAQGGHADRAAQPVDRDEGGARGAYHRAGRGARGISGQSLWGYDGSARFAEGQS